MAQNTVFTYTDDSGNTATYYAQNDGSILCSGWAVVSHESYYFDASGKGLTGLQRVDGTLYYFEDGRVRRNTSVTINEKPYLCLDDGSVIEAALNGWTLADGYYYYAKNGEILKDCVEKIGNAYYGFDSRGQMYSNEEFSICDDSSGHSVYKRYKANADGSLIRNKWVTTYRTVYYGNDGAAYMGLQTIDGKLYYFDDWDGSLFTGTSLSDNKITVDGKDYYADENGVLYETDPNTTTDGWLQKNDSWYYVKNHTILSNCIEKIGDNYYGFDSNGVMQSNGIFTISDSFSPDDSTTYYYDHYYYADKNGHLKKNYWFSRTLKLPYDSVTMTEPYYNQVLYFGDNFEAVTGLQKIDGKLYYFSPALLTDTSVTADQKSYLCRQDGTVVELTNNDWTFAENAWYYVKDHTVLKNCIAKIGDNYYGFQSDGKMYNNTRFTIDSSTYFAQKGGILALNKTVTFDGISYYFNDDGVAYTGIRTINGKKYYYENGLLTKSFAICVDGQNYTATASGALQEISGDNQWIQADGSRYYVKDHTLLKDTTAKINNKWYLFSASGTMYQTNSVVFLHGEPYFVTKDGSLKTNAWGSVNGHKVYYGSDGATVGGITTIDGTKYYFGNPLMYERYYYLLCNYAFSNYSSAESYATDSAGHPTRLKNNAWTKVDGFWYYVKDHSVIKGKIAQIGNAYYGFDSYGHMFADTTFTYHYNYLPAETYTADKNGHITFIQMQDTSDGKYSMDENREAYTGMRTLGQIKYYFEYGQMQKNRAFSYQNGNYVSGSDRRVLSLPYNGWTEVDGLWYFVSNGTLIKDCPFTIGGRTYLFNSDGVMVTNQYCWTSNGYFAADKNGLLLKNSWLKRDDGNWMYFDANGKAVIGRQTINGKMYTFDNADFTLKTNRPAADNGKTYIVTSGGTLKEITSNGWSKVDDYWYYFVDGNAVINNIIQIGSALYGFDSNGHMYQNQEFTTYENSNGYFNYYNLLYYRAGADGKLIVNGTYQENGDVYYYGADGVGVNGYQKLHGVTWFFVNGKQQKDASFCDPDGNYYIADSKGTLFTLEANKWKQVNSHYYYIQNGVLLKDTVALINGSCYGFDSNGRMYSNQTFTDASGNTYHASAGGALLRNRWYSDSTGKYYFDARGIGFEGVHVIDGERCTFSHGKVSYKPAWQKDSKGWWYRHADGSYTKNGWEKINGKYYYFNGSGYMVTGWQKLNGKWYYFEADGSMAGKGWHKIGEKWYYMYESGAMATNTWIGNNYVDADGVWKN